MIDVVLSFCDATDIAHLWYSAITRNFWQTDALKIHLPIDDFRFIFCTSRQAGKLTHVKQGRYHQQVGKKLLKCCVVTIVSVQLSVFDKQHRKEPKTRYLWLAEAEIQISIGFSGLLQGSEISYMYQVTLASS